MDYCKTGLNKFGLMAVAGTVNEVKDNTVTLTVSERMKQADGKWGTVKRNVTCDVTKAGGTNGIEQGMDFCAIGYGRPNGNDMEMEAKAMGTGNCRVEVQEIGNSRVKQGNAWIDQEKPFVFGMVMGDATYSVDQTKNGNKRMRAQFHIEEPYKDSTVIVSDKANLIARNDDKSKAQFDRFVKHLEGACEKANLETPTNADHRFERYPFKSVFLFREEAEKYKDDRYAQIQEFTPTEGRNQGNVYYYRSEFMYQPDFANFGALDMEAIQSREEEMHAFNDRSEDTKAEETETKEEDNAVYDNPFEKATDDGGKDYNDLW